MCVRTKLVSSNRVLDQGYDRIRHACGILGFNQQSIDALREDFRHSSDARAHDAFSISSRFQDDETEWFDPGWQDEQLAGLEKGCHILMRKAPDEHNTIVDPKSPSKLSVVVEHRAVTDKHQGHFRALTAHERERSKQRIDALLMSVP
jgi:hypothetical protein